MNSHIRKISIGNGYPDGAMHYQVGNTIRLQGEPYKVDSILPTVIEGMVGYDIFLKNDDGRVYWKTVSGMPIVIENNINFE